ncbi:MAG TPA: hypothetical protein VH592_15910 [Gemmataceae bacterium]|jgi:hypothetical protein
MSANAYTQEQILSGLRIFWRERLGCRVPSDSDRSFIEHLKANGKVISEIDLIDYVPEALEFFFRFKCSPTEWESFLGLPIQDPNEWEKNTAPRLTFRALANFIRERLDPISFAPVTLLSKPCLTAGVFRGLEQLAEKIHPKVTKFAPSTPIRARLRGFRLLYFWSELRWIMEDQLPPQRQIAFRSWKFLNHLFVKLGIGSLIALCRGDLAGLLEGLAVTVLLFLPVGMVAAWINAQLNPLPKGIETFGDLAGVLAAIILDQQTEAASCSMP